MAGWRGSSVALVRWLLEAAREALELSEPSSADLLHRYVLPKTQAHRCSYVHFVSLQRDDVTGRPVELAEVAAEGEEPGTAQVALLDDEPVGEASVYVTHVWSRPFSELVSALEDFVACEVEHAQAFFWIDLLCLNHHMPWPRAPEIRTEWELEVSNRLAAMSHMCVVATPWPKAAFLSRRWCLWELYCALVEGVKITLSTPKAEVPMRPSAAVEAMEGAVEALAMLCLADSEARHLCDCWTGCGCWMDSGLKMWFTTRCLGFVWREHLLAV